MPRRKASDEIGREEALGMRIKRSEKWTLKEIAEFYEVSIGMVDRICRFKSHIY